MCSKECSNFYKEHRKEFLSEESLQKISEGGKRGIASQGDKRRSKNEKEFCLLCEQYFNNVEHNKNIFNGWDADIILYDYKIAVLWNGPWHYKEISHTTTLKQIQNRDKIKINEVKNCNWTPYGTDPELDKQVDSDNYYVRAVAANQGYSLDKLINDEYRLFLLERMVI